MFEENSCSTGEDSFEIEEENPFRRPNFDLNLINPQVLMICQRLKQAGFDAWIVGGCIRDLLTGKHPKDFDVVTVAKPNEIKNIFRHKCQLVGKRFRIAHVSLKPNYRVEVATLRAKPQKQANTNGKGWLEQDNQFGNSVVADAKRRDFTINSIYFNPNDDVCVDFLSGMKHIEEGKLRSIGDPMLRFREDPVRMIRAARFEAKLGFSMGGKEKEALRKQSPLLMDIPSARLLDESIKLFHTGHAMESFHKLQEHQLTKYLLPLNEKLDLTKDSSRFEAICLKNTDQRIAQNKGVSPSFIYAVFLWREFKALFDEQLIKVKGDEHAFSIATKEVCRLQEVRVRLPQIWVHKIQNMWYLQRELEQVVAGQAAQEMTKQEQFRAAYDFLKFRYEAGEVQLQDCVDFWKPYYQQSPVKSHQRKKPYAHKRRRIPRKKLFNKNKPNNTSNAY